MLEGGTDLTPDSLLPFLQHPLEAFVLYSTAMDPGAWQLFASLAYGPLSHPHPRMKGNPLSAFRCRVPCWGATLHTLVLDCLHEACRVSSLPLNGLAQLRRLELFGFNVSCPPLAESTWRGSHHVRHPPPLLPGYSFRSRCGCLCCSTWTSPPQTLTTSNAAPRPVGVSLLLAGSRIQRRS